MSFFAWNTEFTKTDKAILREGSSRDDFLARLTAGVRKATEALTRGAQSVAGRQTWGAKKRRMEMVESLTLGGRKQLFLVECDRQRYLVGGGAEGVATIVAMAGREAAPLMRPEATSTRGLRLVRRRLDAEGHWTGYENSAQECCEPWR